MTPPGPAVYVEPTTSHSTRWTTSFEDCLEEIKKHKVLHNIQLTEGWQQEVEHQMAMTLKVDNPLDWIEDPENPVVPYLVAYGRAMWAELHARALAFPQNPTEQDKQQEIQWLQGWVGRIPSANCECAYKWKKMGLDFDLSSREGYVVSAINVHNRINESLGKPIYTP